MNKKALWDKFIRTGKISDYLRYRKAERITEAAGADDEEFADELYPDCLNGEDYDYDNEDEWYSDS